MDAISAALYQALRDDSEAVVGLRALLGNTAATPYNVYHSILPETFDFSKSTGDKGAVTYFLVSDTPDPDAGSTNTRLMQAVYNVQGYHVNLATLDTVMRRIKWRLQDMRGITLPNSLGELHRVRLSSEVGERYDAKFMVWWRTAVYRVWYRDDDLHSN